MKHEKNFSVFFVFKVQTHTRITSQLSTIKKKDHQLKSKFTIFYFKQNQNLTSNSQNIHHLTDFFLSKIQWKCRFILKICKRPSGTRLKLKLIHAMTYPIQLFSPLWKRLDYFRLPKHSTAVVCEYLKCIKRTRTLLTWWASKKHTSSYSVTYYFPNIKQRERNKNATETFFKTSTRRENKRKKQKIKQNIQAVFWSGFSFLFLSLAVICVYLFIVIRFYRHTCVFCVNVCPKRLMWASIRMVIYRIFRATEYV